MMRDDDAFMDACMHERWLCKRQIDYVIYGGKTFSADPPLLIGFFGDVEIKISVTGGSVSKVPSSQSDYNKPMWRTFG